MSVLERVVAGAARSLANLAKSSELVKAAISEVQAGIGGPGESGRPSHADQAPARTAMPAGVNYRRTSRADETFSDEDLRNLADVCDLWGAVLCIRKGQVETLDAQWFPWDEDRAEDPEVKAAIADAWEFWSMPDRMDRVRFAQWIGELLEDLHVLGRVYVYPHPTRDGKSIHSMRLIDPATIVPQFSNLGTLKQPPEAAFQQVLNGRIESEYTSEQLYCYELFRRTWKATARSPLEYILASVLTAVRRANRNLSRYTEGVVPEAWLETESGANWEETLTAADAVNERLAGNELERRKLVPLPPGSKARETAPFTYDRNEDEWLARMICAPLGVNPQWFVSMMNRATSETQEAASFDAGIGPLKDRLAAIISELEWIRTGQRLIRFQFTEDESDVSLERGQLLQIFDLMGWAKKSIICRMLGLDPPEGVDELPPGPVQGSAAAAFGPGPDLPDLPEFPADLLGPPGRAELSTWRRVARKAPRSPKALQFVAASIPAPLAAGIRAALERAETPEAVDEVFRLVRGRRDGRPPAQEKHKAEGQAGYRKSEEELLAATMAVLAEMEPDLAVLAQSEFTASGGRP